MFDQINGLPVHPLVVHAAVIFVPLLALGAIVYALVAKWRPKIGWAVLALAVVAPISAFAAMASGNQLHERLLEQGLSGRGAEILDEHMSFGQMTFFASLGLGVVTLVMVLLTLRRAGSLPKAANVGLAVIMVALAAASGYYVIRTGDSGATAVWGQY